MLETVLSHVKWNYCLWGHMLTWQQIQVFCIRSISKTKQTSERKHTEYCVTHLNKTAYKIWSVFDKGHFWVKYLVPFFHRNLQSSISLYFLICSRTHLSVIAFRITTSLLNAWKVGIKSGFIYRFMRLL